MRPPVASPSDLGVPDAATGVVIVDLVRLRANWRALSAQVAPAQCAAVVKADAYGLGADRAVPALVAEGCRTFFVATPSEADQVRRLAPGVIIYVLDGGIDAALLDGIAARPVLGDPGDVAAWAQRARNGRQRLPAAIQLDSGLNRRGLGEAELTSLLADADALAGVELTLVMSHLACADDPDSPMNERQRLAFERLRGRLPPAPASLAASDGLMLGAPYRYDLVRPGYALYGGQAFRGGRAPVEPVMAAFARVLQVRDVAAGESVGYGAAWTARQPRRIATIAAGYADGIFRHAGSSSDKAGGMVAIAGSLCPIVGRVSMDLVTVDVTDAAGDPGPWAELVGPHITLEQAGAAAGTIGYEVLTRLSRRFHRIYLEG